MSAASGLVLDRAVANSFQVAKVFEHNRARINALEFSSNGELLVTSSNDDSINIYDVLEARHQQKVMSQKYGCSLIRLTHAENTAIHASTKENCDIRYLSLHDNSYLRYFQGHKQTVTSLCMSPVSDAFLSASEDGTIRLWDLRSTNCQGVLHARQRPVAAFDNQGMIFAAGLDSAVIKLYDVREFERGPFSTFYALQHRSDGGWTDLCFSPDGKQIAISTARGLTLVIDSFEGNLLSTAGSVESEQGEPIKSSFLPCGKHLISGSRDGPLHIWDANTGSEEARLIGHHDAVSVVKFNPRYMMLASADMTLAFWLPVLDDA